MQENRREAGARLRKHIITKEEEEKSMERVKEINNSITIAKNNEYQRIVFIGGGCALLGLLYVVYSRYQPSDLSQDQSPSDPTSDDDVYLAPFYYSLSQLLLIALSLFAVLALAKLTAERQLKDHRGSRFLEQISEEAFRAQAGADTAQEVNRLKQSEAYKRYQREKVRMRNIEEGLQQQQQVQEEENTLDNLINREEDEDFMEREFMKIDSRINQIRRQMSANENASNLTTYSQPVIMKGGSMTNVSASSNTASKPPGRQSMGPPYNVQNQQKRDLSRSASSVSLDNANKGSKRQRNSDNN